MKEDSIIHETGELLALQREKILKVSTDTSVVFSLCRAADFIPFQEC